MNLIFGVEVNASPLGLLFAFFGGVVSVLSPCVLPVLPGLLGVVSGSSIEETDDKKLLRRAALRSCLAFSVGFSVVYMVIGLATTSLSKNFMEHASWATRVGGIVLLVFAALLILVNTTRVMIVQKEKRPLLHFATGSGSFVTGSAFAFGWSPCIGPILGGVLAYASTEHSMIARMSIIFVYCIGLCTCLSFVVYAPLRSDKVIDFLRRHMRVWTWLSIAIMVIVGLVLVFDKVTWVTAELTRIMDALGLSSLVTIG